MTLRKLSHEAKELFSHIDNSISKSIQIINPKSSCHIMIHGPKEPLPDRLKDPQLIEELFREGYLELRGDRYEIPESLRSIP